jgi:hypothetical protein
MFGQCSASLKRLPPIICHVIRRLLYTRGQTGEALGGISVSSVIRLENEGKLRKVRLRGETGQVFNPVADVEALASAVKG